MTYLYKKFQTKRRSCERTYTFGFISISAMAGLVEDTLPTHTKDHDESKLAIAGYPLLLSLLILVKFFKIIIIILYGIGFVNTIS
jgi:hypothetical protein